MSDLADCFEAIAVRPDGLVLVDRMVADYEPGHRSVNSAEVSNRSLVIDDFELTNSTRNTLGAILG